MYVNSLNESLEGAWGSLAQSAISSAASVFAARSTAKAQTKASAAAVSSPVSNPFVITTVDTGGITQQKWFWPAVVGVGAILSAVVVAKVLRK